MKPRTLLTLGLFLISSLISPLVFAEQSYNEKDLLNKTDTKDSVGILERDTDRTNEDVFTARPRKIRTNIPEKISPKKPAPVNETSAQVNDVDGEEAQALAMTTVAATPDEIKKASIVFESSISYGELIEEKVFPGPPRNTYFYDCVL